jgi:hypothetical protein
MPERFSLDRTELPLKNAKANSKFHKEVIPSIHSQILDRSLGTNDETSNAVKTCSGYSN